MNSIKQSAEGRACLWVSVRLYGCKCTVFVYEGVKLYQVVHGCRLSVVYMCEANVCMCERECLQWDATCELMTSCQNILTNLFASAFACVCVRVFYIQ